MKWKTLLVILGTLNYAYAMFSDAFILHCSFATLVFYLASKEEN